ncbi:MAG TPA: hypothetical protein VLH09_13540 [Bryobacteraceae bacterium]|nr:hypothetical protein [Bryobacteraceae bacterium]
MLLRFRWWLCGVLVAACAAGGQVIEFESGGLRYQTLSKGGVTVMFAHLPTHIREYSIVQATVSNGSSTVCAVRPEDFAFRFPDGREVRAAPAQRVVTDLMDRAGRNDVIRLVSTYEIGLYGLSRYQSTSGYEKRRQAALAEVTSGRLKAAAAASAIAFVEIKLKAGESTDGALFFPARGSPLAGSRLRASAAGQLFEFNPEPAVR